MREFTLPLPAITNEETQNSIEIFRQRKTRWTVAAFFFVVSGFLFGASGFTMSVLAYLESGEFARTNSRIGGYLIFAAFPLFFLAAHALDKIALNRRAEKLANCRKNGIFFEDYK